MKTLCASLAVVLLVSSAPAADWLHWRGPNQTGVAFDTGLLLGFRGKPADGPLF